MTSKLVHPLSSLMNKIIVVYLVWWGSILPLTANHRAALYLQKREKVVIETAAEAIIM